MYREDVGLRVDAPLRPDHRQLLEQRLPAVLQAQVRHVRLSRWPHVSPSDKQGEERATDLVDLVARGPGEVPLLTEPVALDLHLEPALDDGVARELGQRALRQLIDLQVKGMLSTEANRLLVRHSRAPQRYTLLAEVPVKHEHVSTTLLLRSTGSPW